MIKKSQFHVSRSLLSAVLNLNRQTRPEIKILSFCTWFSLKQLITCSFWFSSQCEECVGLVNSVHLTRAWKKNAAKIFNALFCWLVQLQRLVNQTYWPNSVWMPFKKKKTPKKWVQNRRHKILIRWDFFHLTHRFLFAGYLFSHGEILI